MTEAEIVDRWPGGLHPTSGEPLQNDANAQAVRERRKEREASRTTTPTEVTP